MWFCCRRDRKRASQSDSDALEAGDGLDQIKLLRGVKDKVHEAGDNRQLGGRGMQTR